MKRILSLFSVVLVVFIIVTSLSLPVFSTPGVNAESSKPPILENKDTFIPTVLKPASVDQDDNGIADTLDREISEKTANGTAQDTVGVTIMLKGEPTSREVDDFTSSGGCVTTSLWNKATYGFGGTITYDRIGVFVGKCSNLMLVDKKVVGEFNVAYATQQAGARNYVWNALGLQGDPNSSIAILDTGIDGSHEDFSPGYGNQDFSKKIVGWQDFINFTSTPFDDGGHGSHCAGLAAGKGFGVDSSGYANATWGTSLSGFTYTWTGLMVNNSGVVTLSAKWLSTGTANLSSLSLYKSGKNLSSWSKMQSVSTPVNNTWYTLSYVVTSKPSGGYDTYNPRVDATSGNGTVYVVVNASWPYTPPSDGFSAWTGIAPKSKLVGVRIGNSTTPDGDAFIDGVQWIIDNKEAYHITAASMSLSLGNNPLISSVVRNLVNSGVTTVVSAGNDGPGGNKIDSPGSVDEVITVAAINQFDNTASYSSQGGTSGYTGKTTKPDITAPGGSGVYGPEIFSADTNYNDANGQFADVQPNDSAPKAGTSMACPIIAGCAQVVIQAMGGYSKWNWTISQALQPKMILLMTATETYPSLREGGSTFTSPTLGRGWKDVHEGYGRVNLDAAVDALSKSYEVGSSVTDTLGKPPTILDISVVGQKLAWARSVQLASGNTCNFSLTVPAGADYDMYLYNNTGTTYGEPSIVAKSTTAVTGGTEQFYITPPYTGTYYIVVKRATEDTGAGVFTLESSSSGPVDVTVNTPGVLSASNIVHYTQNGISKTGSISANKFSDYADIGTIVTIDNPINVSATQRYKTTEPTIFKVKANITAELTYTRENITLESLHPYLNNTDYTWPPLTRLGATSIRVHFSYMRIGYSDYIYIIDYAGNSIERYTGTFTSTGFWSQWVPGDTVKVRLTSDSSYSYDGFVIDMLEWESQPVTTATDPNDFAATYKSEYLLTVNSPYGSKSGDGWYENGTTTYANLTAGTVDHGNGTRRIFMNWSGDAAGTNYAACSPICMNASKTVTANWKTQHFITVNSSHDAPTASQWTDQDASFIASVTSPTEIIANNAQWICTGYNLDGGLPQLGINYTFANIQAPRTIVFNWKQQFYLTVNSAHGSPSGEGWYDSGSTAKAVLSNGTVSGGIGVQYIFTDWGGDASGNSSTSNSITMNSGKTATANWKTQYRVSFAANPGGGGTVLPSSDTLIDQGANQISISASASSGYSFSSWSATTGINIASAQSSGTTATVTGPGTITANFAANQVNPPIPEFTQNLLLPLFMTTTLLLALGFKKAHKVSPKSKRVARATQYI